MFWNIDVKEQEQDLMEVSHFLLSVFEFAADSAGKCVPERRLAGFRPGEWSLVLQAL